MLICSAVWKCIRSFRAEYPSRRNIISQCSPPLGQDRMLELACKPSGWPVWTLILPGPVYRLRDIHPKFVCFEMENFSVPVRYAEFYIIIWRSGSLICVTGVMEDNAERVVSQNGNLRLQGSAWSCLFRLKYPFAVLIVYFGLCGCFGISTRYEHVKSVWFVR